MTLRTIRAKLALPVLVLALCTVRLFGQAVAGGQISGVVADPSGAAVPNAKVTVTQTDIGLVRTTVSGTDGIYVLPNLPVGPYKLQAEVAGFETYLQTGIRLEVGGGVSINITLHMGAVKQNVQVTANANMVQTQTTSVAQVIDQQRMVELPLNGRQPTQLIYLAGAANAGPGGDVLTTKDYPTSVVIAVAGGQQNGTNYLLDGGVHMDAWMSVNLPLPFPDALQEFSVQTSTLEARYGLHAGATVNAVTKSGTNSFHGDAFEFLRNGAVNARNFFAAETDSLKRNQFGGTIGGPIKKDKLFGFFGYQGTRIRTAPGSNIAHVPTQAVLNGDWSMFESATCVSTGARSIINPATGQVFANSQVSPTLYNPPALSMLKLIPVSSNPCGQVTYTIPEPQREDQYIGRVDWSQSTTNSFFGRYFFTDYKAPASYNGNLLLVGWRGIWDRVQAQELGDTYVISPTTINTIHLGWNRLGIHRGPTADTPNPRDFGINVYDYVPNNLEIYVNGYMSASSADPSWFADNSFHVMDDMELMRGRHHVSVGGEWVHYQYNFLTTDESNGNWSFNGQYSNDALLDFMLGLPNNFAQAGPQLMSARQDTPALYVTDNFRLSKHLSLQLGLRWEPLLPEREIFNRIAWFNRAAFDEGKQSAEYTNAPPGLFFPGDAGYPRSGFAWSKLAIFEPRAGLVWDPRGNGRQTIRVGYGLFYDQPGAAYIENINWGAPWADYLNFAPSMSGGLTNPYLGYAGGNPFPIAVPPPRNAVFPAWGEYYLPNVDFQPIQMQQWNISYQRQLTANWLVSATYVGNKTSHIWLDNEYNPSVYIPGTCNGAPCSTPANANQRRELYLQNPVAGSLISALDVADTGANADYDGLILATEHRFSNHYTLLGNYTWSHCLSEGDQVGDIGGTGYSYQNPWNRDADRGNCGFDLRHVINLSFVAETPHFAAPWANRLLGNWQLAPIVSRTSGTWFSPMTGLDNSLSAVGMDRPDLVGNPYQPFNRSSRQWLDPQAFVPNALGTFGNSGRDSLRGPGYFDVDTALTRRFNIKENRLLEVRFETFNLFNHTNFSPPDNTLTDPTFGEILAAGSPRILQFALKYVF